MNPAGPGYKEAHVPSSIEGRHDGREQRIHCGSWACVDGNRHFARLRSMTLQAIVWPTRPGGRAQTIMSLWNPDAGQGVRLDINARGELEAVLAQGGRTETVASGHAGARVVFGGLVDRRGRRRAHLASGAAPRLRPRRRPRPRAAAAIGAGAGRQTLLAFAATPAPAGGIIGTALMNGKIDRPRLSARALDEAEIRALEDPSFQGMRTAGVVGCGISRAGWNPSRSRTSAATNCTAARSTCRCAR